MYAFGNDFETFIRGTSMHAGLGYGDRSNNDYHAKLLVKNGNKIEMYDPWIQGIKHTNVFYLLKLVIKNATGYELVKIDRPPEQTDLGIMCTERSWFLDCSC